MNNLFALKKILLLLTMVLTLHWNASAQTTFQVLNEILGSEFISCFDGLRLQAEKMVKDAKGLEGYHPGEVESLQIAYDASAEHFNLVLHNLKTILLTKEKRKYYFGHNGKNICEFHKLIEADINRAERMFNITFRKEYQNLMSDPAVLDSFVGSLIMVIQDYLPLAIELFKKIKAEVARYNESLLDEYLIEAHRFKSWDEI